MNLNRRNFLFLIGAAVTNSRYRLPPARSTAAPVLSSLFLAAGGRIAEARAYYSTIMHEAHFDDSLAREIVSRHAMRDFQQGDTVELDGWILSRSEVLFFVSIDP